MAMAWMMLYILLDLLLGWSEEEDDFDVLPNPLRPSFDPNKSAASWLVSGAVSELNYDTKVAEARERIRAARKEHPEEPLPEPFVPVAVIALCRAMAEAAGEPTEEQWEAMMRVLRGHEAFAKFRPEGLEEMLARAARGTAQPVELLVDDLRYRFPDEQLGAILTLLEEVMRADGKVWAAEQKLLAAVRERLEPHLPKAPAKAPTKEAG